MNPIGARKCHSFIAISKLPDVCLTPCGNAMEPVPYAIIGRLDSSQGTVASVRANGEPLFVLDASTVPAVTGNEAGEGGGVNSGVCMGSVRATTASSSVRANGKFLVRHGDECEMNIGPMNVANTYGIITNEAICAPQGRIVDGEAENCASESETSDETECESFDPEPHQVAAVGQPEPNAHLQALIDKANELASKAGQLMSDPFETLPMHNEAEQVGANMASVLPVGALGKGARFKAQPPKPKTSNPAHQQATARTKPSRWAMTMARPSAAAKALPSPAGTKRPSAPT